MYIPQLLLINVSTLTEFEQLSGLKANLEKSDITRVGRIQESNVILPAGGNFTWTSGVFSYLGIKFSVNTKDICNLNYNALIFQGKVMSYADAYCNDSELGKILIHKQLYIWKKSLSIFYGKVCIKLQRMSYISPWRGVAWRRPMLDLNMMHLKLLGFIEQSTLLLSGHQNFVISLDAR